MSKTNNAETRLGDNATITTLDQFARVITSVFDDGNYNEGRWLVLWLFTVDLGKKYPDLKEAFVNEYWTLKNKMNVVL